jgi:small subunit ribosomal protein S6
MRDYESIVVFKPDLDEEQFEQGLNKLEEIIKKQKGKITDLQKWGLRSLAYEIQKYKQGNYVLIHFQCDPKAIAKIERNYKLTDSIIRFLTVNIQPSQVKKTEKTESVPEEVQSHG